MLRLVLLFTLACGHREVPRESVRPVASDASITPATTFDAAAAEIADAPLVDAAEPADAEPSGNIFPILAVVEDGTGSILTVQAGKDRGITTSWHAVLVDDDNRPVDNGRVTIKQVAGKTCRVRSTLDARIVKDKYHRVRFNP